MAYCVYSPPQRLREKVQSFVKRYPRLQRWRVGENVLVRWAYEDMPLEDGEEDVMVNGGVATDPIYAGEEEQIPLKPSPRKASVTSYGTAK